MSKKTLPRGKFISFEGGEGAGKSTQVNLLRDHLSGMGIDVVLTREPGGAPGAEEIRQLLVTGEPDKWVPMTEILLFYAARVDHLERTVLPALAQGKWVISDRYADSTFAYQGAGQGVDSTIVQQIHQLATNNYWPDLTLILDTDPAVGLRRATAREAALSEEQREDRYEKMQGEFHARLRQAFLDIADKNPERCHVVTGGGTIGDVSAQIWQQVAAIFGLGL